MCGFFMAKKDLKSKISEAANMPKDILAGLPVIKVWGNSEIYIENFKGIIEYLDTIIRIQTKIGKVVITGKCMQIEYYTNEDMKITGIIFSIEYHSEG